jgi:D-3-phosphoglycerate dehydrogenase
MAAWKILLTDGLEKNGQVILQESAIVDDRRGIAADELLQIADQYDAIIVRGRTKITPAVLDAASNLKVVGRAGVGVDNIDLNAARAHGVTVVNSPLATTNAVAELVLGLMLALVREIPRADAAMDADKWLKKELVGIELGGKTLGIIGFGRIGSTVGRFASVFGMRILACDPLVSDEDIRSRGGEPVSLDELLAQSDMISLHTPLTPETRGLIGADVIARMKSGVRIVCAARGGVIDEDALLDGLNSGKVAGVALDVFASEPCGATELVRHPNVVTTPHIGAQTVEAQERAAEDIATEVLAALRNDALRWKVA